MTEFDMAADTDGDGKVDADELRALLLASPGPLCTNHSFAMFALVRAHVCLTNWAESRARLVQGCRMVPELSKDAQWALHEISMIS
jgi:hypothetical protein